MDEVTTSSAKAFFKSPHHAWLAALTLGVGFATGNLLGLIVGATAYALGWVYLPGMPFFRKWVDNRIRAVEDQEKLAQYTAFNKRRQALLDTLSKRNRNRYQELADVCAVIEALSRDALPSASVTEPLPTLHSLDELMWTFLRLLAIQDTLETHLEVERREDVPNLLKVAQDEYATLKDEIDNLDHAAHTAEANARRPLLDSRRELAEVLRKRLDRINQTNDHLELVLAEQERLEQQIKLLRTEAVATKNAAAVIARIDGTLAHLNNTNKWLSEFEDFKDLIEDIPRQGPRVGYGPVDDSTNRNTVDPKVMNKA
ncbi:MAG: hypothetical protein SFY80_07210 [Verrucomicrobiota bacterium]|nr:hypothetical protein [Verrucomicrobiota bacterium]